MNLTANNLPVVPAHKVGKVLGQLTVTTYLGRDHYHPETGKHYMKPFHWYAVRCSCGTSEIASQDQLRKRRMCKECAMDSRMRGTKIERPVDLLPAHLDFARLKW